MSASSAARRSEPPALAFALHPVLPVQYGRRRDAERGHPQRRLMLAVLQTALEDCAMIAADGRRFGRQPHRLARSEATAFVLSRDRSWPFSFENICEAVGFDAEAIRRRVVRGHGEAAR